ncbi:ABC transporter permease [Streptomyces sp. 4N509B]|uniref:ABC transporter permease n=1 Tax=Streptomyces sp. 4N509B TaxID=3457413 RepID=UPI003FD2F033
MSAGTETTAKATEEEPRDNGGPSGAEKAAEEAFVPTAAAIQAVLTSDERPQRPSAWSASLTFGWRAMLKIKHVPEQLFDISAFPILMTLMFTYLFGGALAGSPSEYLQYLLPGIMVMSVIMTTVYTGLAINADIQKGIFDRFRTLPVWRPAPMVGYLLGDAFRYAIASAVILVVGMVLGYRPDGGVLGVLGGIGLLVAFSFAFSWMWTLVGMLVRTERAVMSISMMVIFPLSFLSNILVDPETTPGWVQGFVEVNPVTHLVAAVRSLMDGDVAMDEVAWVAVAGALLIAVFGTLTMRLYNRK